MEATPRSAAWSGWAGWAERDGLPRRRVRLTVHELADVRVRELALRDWPRLPPHQVALYTPKQIRHLIRLENALGRVPTSAPDRWRRPDPDAYWRVQDFLQNVRLERPALSAELPVRSSEPLEAPVLEDHHWENAARGWAAGAVVLAVLVLLVRALERFLHRKLFKGQRRQSVEWPTPNVLATSHRYGSDIGPPPRLDDSDTFPSDGRESGNDLPPPYSECANNEDNMPLENIDPNKPIGNEDEPPPPYSACYFSNPKDGIPTVHFYNRRHHNQDLGQTSEESNNEPSISNVRQTSQENDRIAHVGCESNVSLESNVAQIEERVHNNGNAIIEMNAESIQEVEVRRGDENLNHVVDIVESHSSQARVVTV